MSGLASSLDRDAILALLPHRDPFVFVDRVDGLVPGERGTGSFAVRDDAFWVGGHFPGRPIFPGVLLTEAMAQVAAVIALSAVSEHAGEAVYLVGLDAVRFRSPVVPGDRVEIDVERSEVRRGMWTFLATARVGDRRVATGRLLAALAGAA